MSEKSDPNDITNALAAAIDAFNEEGYGIPTYEAAIDPDTDWKTQLTAVTARKPTPPGVGGSA